MQTFGVNAEVAFLHGPLMTFHYFLGQGKDILTLQRKWAKLIILNSYAFGMNISLKLANQKMNEEYWFAVMSCLIVIDEV